MVLSFAETRHDILNSVVYYQQNGVQPLSSYGTALQRLGVDAFVLGIGKDIEYRDLGQVVRDAKNVFLVQMFQSLNSIDRQLAYEIVTRTVGKSHNIRSYYMKPPLMEQIPLK